jgi:mxaJ protein
MPFSNSAGQGFENHVATYMARALGDKLVYVWASTRGAGGFDQFVHETLDKKKCDIVMDVPYASANVSTSTPYYISSYVFIFPKKKAYDITSMDSPALDSLRIGFEADTPAENGLKLRTLILHATPFDSTDAPNSKTNEMLQALSLGKIAVGVTWEPAVGYYLRSLPQYSVVPVPNARSQGAPEQYAFPMSMGTRLGNTAMRDRLNAVIAMHKAQLTAILARDGVKLYQPANIASQ